MYYYVYVLLSEKDNQFYTGYTSDLKNRLNEHQSGKVQSTKYRLPLKLIYFEGLSRPEIGCHSNNLIYGITIPAKTKT